MASLKYQIATHIYDKSKYLQEPAKDKDGNLLDTTKITAQTEKQYKHHAITFGEWCKENFGCKNFDDCRPFIQAYADFLDCECLSPSTIHTYLAGICRIWGVDMASIRKPIRHVADNTRSRGVKAVDKRRDAQREASPDLYDLAELIGLRRREYQRLTGGSLINDESGHPCVCVKGKGGKIQYQRVLDVDIEVICDFFAQYDPDQLIFTKRELNNKIDLHHLRAMQAQRAYRYYLRDCQTEERRAKLAAEVEARFLANGKKWDPELIQGTYYLRGLNRKFALDHNLPTAYNRLALMAVSVFHLSHWRLDVTVANYMLAI